MSPQYSSPAHAALRCRDALQIISCTVYKTMHQKAFIKARIMHHILSSQGWPSHCVYPCEIGDWSKNTSVVSCTPSEPGHRGIPPPLAGSSSGILRRITPFNNHIKFNRMNGSPGAPPGTRMHTFKLKRITPFNHRLASDPSGKEAGWETTT